MQSPENDRCENKGSLRLTLVTDDGSPLNEKVEIRLSNRKATDNRFVHAVASQPLLISNLVAFPHGLCDLAVVPGTSESQKGLFEILPDQTADLSIFFQVNPKPPPPP